MIPRTPDPTPATLIRQVKALRTALRKYGYHTWDCAFRAQTCRCRHVNTQHFCFDRKACAHCPCKKFQPLDCTCGFEATVLYLGATQKTLKAKTHEPGS
jgi:hypothetical protein